MGSIEESLNEKRKQIAEALRAGKAVEIYIAKDGLRVYEVKKKTI